MRMKAIGADHGTLLGAHAQVEDSKRQSEQPWPVGAAQAREERDAHDRSRYGHQILDVHA
jgi:hypothetical protein